MLPQERHHKKRRGGGGAGGTHRWRIGAPEQNGKRLLAEARGLSAPPAIAEEKNDGEEKEESFWIKV